LGDGARRVDHEGLLSTALHQADAGFSLADQDAGDLPMVWVSRGFERMTGYRSAEIVGVNCRHLQTDASDPSTISAMREAIDSATPIRVCVWNSGKDGAGFWNCLSMHPFWVDGSPRYFVASQVRLSPFNHKKLVRVARKSITSASSGFGQERYMITRQMSRASEQGSYQGSYASGRQTCESSRDGSTGERSPIKSPTAGGGLPMVDETPATGQLNVSQLTPAVHMKPAEAHSPAFNTSSSKSSTCVLL